MADTDLLMPPVGADPEADSAEERRRRALTIPPAATALPAVPVASTTPLTPSGKDLAVGATSQPTLPPVKPREINQPGDVTPGIGKARAEIAEKPPQFGGPAMPPVPMNPSGTAAQPVNPANVRPELHGWRKALDVIGSMFPLGRTIETAIPGTPQNFNARQAMEAARTATGQKLEQGRQEIEAGAAKAQFDTPEKRRAYIAQHPDEFEGVDDFQKNDFILAGKFPQREPAGPKQGDKKVDEGFNAQGQRVVTYEKPDGTRYNSVNPDIVQKSPEDAGKLAAEIEAQVGPKPTTPQFGGKTYPSVQEAQAAWGKAAQGIKDAEARNAAMARGEGYGQARLMQMYEMLDSSQDNRSVRVTGQQILDEPNRYIPAASGAKALRPEAGIADIRAGIDQVREAYGVLDEGFKNRAQVAFALAQPKDTFNQWLLGQLDKGNLTDNQVSYVTAVQSLVERAMAIRQLAGMGQGAEDLRNAIIQTLPGPGTPNKKYAETQLARLSNLVDQLEKGIPKVPLRGSEKAAPEKGKGKVLVEGKDF